ncbi:MAG: lysophospholipid acyltransferase family protein [Spirochaetales bacterium]|nr:lysophospholipid acyltransferase family protein [Spirochaetales bacterium]
MIKAHHRLWAQLFFNRYLDRLIKKNFEGFYLVNELPSLPLEKSLLFTPNHISWWDGFFAYSLLRILTGRAVFLMMLERELRRYRYFSKIGAYSINPSSGRETIRSIAYTAEILDNPDRAVIFYPQGEIEPYWKRPLSIKRGGLRSILSGKYGPLPHCERTVLVAGFCINYGNKKYPDIIVRFGEPLSPDEIIGDFKRYEAVFHENLDRLDRAVCGRDYIRNIMPLL